MDVDDFINDYNQDPYARFVLHIFRLPADLQTAFQPWTKRYKLFCTYEGKRYRITGASRMGDVWLHDNFDRTYGYKHRVDISQCSNWGEFQ